MKQNKHANLPFSKLSVFLNHSNSTDAKGPLNPASAQNNYIIYVIVDPLAITW